MLIFFYEYVVMHCNCGALGRSFWIPSTILSILICQFHCWWLTQYLCLGL